MARRTVGARIVLPSLLVALAVVAIFAPLSPQQVERWFSNGIYPRIQHSTTPLLNLVPFALFDVLLAAAVAALGWMIVTTVRAVRREGAARSVTRLFGRIVISAAVVYLVFLCVWGFNYRRVPLQQRLMQSESVPTADQVLQFGLRAAAVLNAQHDEAHREGWNGREWQDPRLRRAFDEVQRALSDGMPAVPGRLKETAVGPYLRWASVDGMVNPFGLEVLANPDLLPFERPFVAAHEWGHLAGYADESEASFVGWLTCLRGPIAAQYSGWLFVYWQVSGEMPEANRTRLAGALADGPRRDVQAVIDRLRRGRLPLLSRTSWLMYDKYLKANRVEEGVRSYGLALTLMLRTRFDAAGAPIRRLP